MASQYKRFLCVGIQINYLRVSSCWNHQAAGCLGGYNCVCGCKHGASEGLLAVAEPASNADLGSSLWLKGHNYSYTATRNGGSWR